MVAGDGPARPALEALSAALGVGDRVTFLGWVDADESRRLLGAARVLALPSLWEEPFGLVGIEALAAGTPVVASEIGGVPTWLADGQGGFLVPPGDERALAHALRRVLAEDALHATLAAAAPSQAARFSIDNHLAALLPELQAAAE